MKVLQTGFQVGMEAMLGVRPGGRDVSIQDEINSYEREEVRQADRVAKELVEEAKGGKKGLTITYFEPVEEGEVGLSDSYQIYKLTEPVGSCSSASHRGTTSTTRVHVREG